MCPPGASLQIYTHQTVDVDRYQSLSSVWANNRRLQHAAARGFWLPLLMDSAPAPGIAGLLPLLYKLLACGLVQAS